MSGKDKIARGYASATDDIRHHLIDQGWHGIESKDDSMRRDVDASIARYDQKVADSAWERLPEAERFNEPKELSQEDLADYYGDSPQADQSHDSPLSEQELADFYGDAPANGADRDALYGSRSNDGIDQSDFYGNSPEPQEHGDFYGHDIEQDRN